MSQKIIVSSLPWKDYSRNKWMLSASVSIQLDGAAGVTLGAYPDILQWLGRLQGAVFFVQWNNDKPQDLVVTNSYWDTALYQNLFSSSLVVKPFQLLNAANISLKSFPVGHIRDFILNTYNEVGNLTPAALPTAGFYVNQYKKLADISRVQLVANPPAAGGPHALKDLVTIGHAGKKQAAQLVGRSKVIPYSAQPNPALDFGQFHNYFDLPNAGFQPPPAPPKPALEYHDILSIIMDYPIIQRKLGLILDFELGGPPPAANGFVRIIPANLQFQDDLTLSTPPTAYEATAAGFYTASGNGSTIDKGLLLLNSPNFSVVEIDTEGSAMKLTGHADKVYFSAAQASLKVVNRRAMAKSAPVNKAASGRPLPKRVGANGEELGAPPEEDTTEEGLPALRSAGIGIVHNGLAASMASKFTRMTAIYKGFTNPAVSINSAALYNRQAVGAKNAERVVTAAGGASTERIGQLRGIVGNSKNIPMPPDTLYADDLVRGYRIDIAYDNNAGAWYSLHQRINQYAYAPLQGTAQPVNLPSSPFVDEGCIQLSLTQEAGDPAGTQKLNEVVARWEGWSLSVPRPGKSLNNTGDPVSSDADEQKKYQLDDSVSFRLQVNTQPAPKTLPMLRFGQSYSVKIRTVDLAGNSLPCQIQPEDPSGSVISGIKYLRYEPLPVAVLREGNEIAGGASPNGERDGESLELMVVRSNVNVSAEQYETSNPTTLYSNGQVTGTVSWLPQAVRHVLAPPASQLLAETHGMFDAAFKDPGQASSIYQLISSRDNPTVNNPDIGKAPVYPVTQQQVDIGWLADPMAAGVILTMESATSFETPWRKGVSRQFSFYFDDEVTAANAGTPFSVDQWKTPRSFRIILEEGNAAPAWSAGNRTLTVYLPKSAQVQINYACFWRPDDLNLVSGMHACITKGGSSTAAQLALKGLHWMVSPWRTIRLVHAVQQPLQAPQFGNNVSQITRNYGDTFIYITTRISVHGPSSDKIDVSANWTEWTDDLTGDGPRQVGNVTHVDTIQIAYTDKVVTCVIATRNTVLGAGVSIKGPIYQAFGDTRHRSIDYVPVATTRYREYFSGLVQAAAVTKQVFPLTQPGAAVSLNILSSARPTVPAIEYLLPSFNWATTTKGNTITHVRTGNIRVYVKRPWYSSGDDERLAVVLSPKGANAGANQMLSRYCTVWGIDPVFSAPALNNSNYPTRDNFPYAADYDTVRLAEDINTMVDVSAYAVNYDQDKQFYFFDIPVNILSAYFPLVKLTLARYQRNALRISGTDVCLSKLVSTDWMQVVPGREAAITLNPGKANFTVSMSGVAPFGVGNPRMLAYDNDSTRTRIRVQVQSGVIPKSEEALIAVDAPGPGTLVWEKDFDISLSQLKNGQIQFSTEVKLDREWAKKPYRVLICEYELHPFDPLRTVELTKIGQPKNNQTVEWSERLVFMDMFEVNGVV